MHWARISVARADVTRTVAHANAGLIDEEFTKVAMLGAEFLHRSPNDRTKGWLWTNHAREHQWERDRRPTVHEFVEVMLTIFYRFSVFHVQKF